MRTLLILPAVAVPLAVVVLVVAVRRIGDAFDALRAELAAGAALRGEVSALQAELRALSRRRVQRPLTPR